MPTMGLLSGVPPMEPWNDESPKLKMPPSDPTIQYPLVVAARGATVEADACPAGAADATISPATSVTDRPAASLRTNRRPCIDPPQGTKPTSTCYHRRRAVVKRWWEWTEPPWVGGEPVIPAARQRSPQPSWKCGSSTGGHWQWFAVDRPVSRGRNWVNVAGRGTSTRT